MKLHFLGAAREVTGSCFLVEALNVRFLVDCGMVQGGRTAAARNHEPFPFDPASIDFVLLTHAHIDHSGLLPKLTRAGFKVDTYRYYEPALQGIDFDGMLADLRRADAGTIVLLHACCHNPTGYDLTPAQWDQVIDVLRERDLMPFLDMAYQGFGFGIEEDGAVVAKFVASGLEFFIATSFSKSFSLYGERIGSLSVVTGSADAARRVLSQLKICIRTNYSNPSTHGAALVATVLGDQELRRGWEQELAEMRDRIKQLRRGLVAALEARGVQDMGFIAAQMGMFSYSGLTKPQMVALRSDYGIYGTDAGRMCVAALNHGNLSYVADAIAAVRSAQ